MGVIAAILAVLARTSMLEFTPAAPINPIGRTNPGDLFISFFSQSLSGKYFLIVADCLQAVVAGFICFHVCRRRQMFVVAFTAFLFSPVIFFCSDILCESWSVAGLFSLLALYSLIHADHHRRLIWQLIGMFSYALALLFKWQALFMLPLFLFALLHRPESFLFILGSMLLYILGSLAIGIMPFQRIADYFLYAKEKGLLSLGFPNYWFFCKSAYPDLSKAGFGLALLSLIVAFIVTLEKRPSREQISILCTIGSWVTLAVVTFLPGLDYKEAFFPLIVFLISSCINPRLFLFSIPLEFGWLLQLSLCTWASKPELEVIPYLISLGVLFVLPVYIISMLRKTDADSLQKPHHLHSILTDRSSLMVFCAFVLGVLIRYTGRSVISRDFNIFLYNWFGEIKVNGIGTQVGNYSVLYQLVLYILSKVPLSDRNAIKLFSVIFDIFLSVSVGSICFGITRKKSSFALGFTIAFCMPSSFLNSAYWAQCDSIYTFFAILGVSILIGLVHSRKKTFHLILSMTLLGISLAFKLQAVFVLPFIIYLYVRDRSFSIFALFIPVIINILIPVACGRSPFDSFYIYSMQTVDTLKMHMNFMNLWSILFSPDINFDLFHNYAVMLTMIFLGGGLFYVLQYPQSLSSAVNRWKVFIWTVMTTVMFLPSIHDRYGYMMNIALIILIICDYRFIPLFAVIECCTFLLYVCFLWQNTDYTFLVFIPAYFVYTVILFFTLKKELPRNVSADNASEGFQL